MMRKFFPASLAAFVLIAAGALAQNREEAPGTALYRSRCARCHQLSGAPVEAIERRMGVTMRHLGSPDVQAKSDEQLGRDTVDGIGKMPPTRNLKEEEVADLVRYMRGLKLP